MQLVLLLKGHVTAGSDPFIYFGLFELDAASYFIFIVRDIAKPLPSADGLVRRMRGMVGAQLFHGEILILLGILIADSVTDKFDFCDAIEDACDGFGEFVECDCV